MRLFSSRSPDGDCQALRTGTEARVACCRASYTRTPCQGVPDRGLEVGIKKMSAGQSNDETNVLEEALWRFRPEVELPFPLVKLAVEVDTGRRWGSRELKDVLDRIVAAGRLTKVPTSDILESQCKISYKLSPKVSAELNRHDRQDLFQEPPANPGPQRLTVEEGHLKQRLLAAFLLACGRVQDAQNVPQMAAELLQRQAGGEFNGWENSRMSQLPHAEELARMIEDLPEGLSAEMVIAAVLASNGTNLPGMAEPLRKGLAQLLDYFFSKRAAGERQSCRRLLLPSSLCGNSLATFALL